MKKLLKGLLFIILLPLWIVVSIPLGLIEITSFYFDEIGE